MRKEAESPGISPGGLVTVAFLKAQIDDGSDHLGMFMPLILDVISRLPLSTFTVEEIQLALSAVHKVSMPKHVIVTLLRRAANRRLIESVGGGGVYQKGAEIESARSAVDARKEQIERGQRRLAESLRLHAERRKLEITSVESALDLLFKFLESEQVGLLLETPASEIQTLGLGVRERSVVAEFIETIVLNDPALLAVLRGMLEGLVLYHAAFLPDLSTARMRFRSLRVLFDGALLREALGYAGPALKALLREATDVLRASGIECAVFEDTLDETRRVLAKYEAHLGTPAGRAGLWPVPMTRHFITQGYGPSDMAEMSTFLVRDTAAAGFRILARPPREHEFTAGEKELAARLRGPNAGPEREMEPRVIHDVECVAGVLTLRRGRRAIRLEDAGVIFATDSASVIKTVQSWWREDEKESSVAPIVHIRALTNLAWLKRPSLCGDFKIQELVALCAAALEPRQSTWERFFRHLSKLQQSQRITSDEAAAILVSELLDRSLKTAEFESADPNDVDIATLDEAVERVKASYAADARRKVQAAEEDKTAAIAEAAQRTRKALERADAAERTVAESARRRALKIQERARRWAHSLTQIVRWATNLVLLAGVGSLLSEHHFHPGTAGILIGCCLIAFVFLEFAGARRHVAEWLGKLEDFFEGRFLVFFGIDD
jgi:hypothetical protein